jgi:hypothetical protein
MRHPRLLRFRLRYALLAALALLVGAAAGALTARAHAGAAVARSAGAGSWMAAVALPVPSPGDVSYAVARVRIGPGSRLSSPTGLAGQQTIFASRVGGLAIRAQARSWRALRASTRVYVVVSMVPGADRSLRDVGLFILRRKTGAGHAGANVTFTIANARAQVGSFWVQGVDRRGYATVFAIRNLLSTAIGNWSRYIRALQLAHAIAAAAHPLVLSAAPTASAAAAKGRIPGPWTGGQRPNASVVAMFRLIFSALADPTAYAALKRDPVIGDFISTELGNPSLAARWRAVVAQVPLKVPDQYAAAAQEERRFTRVVPPKLSHARVAMTDWPNSSSQLFGDVGFSDRPMSLTVDTDVRHLGLNGGVVTDSSGHIDCPRNCTWEFPQNYLRILHLTATPGVGFRFDGWRVYRMYNGLPSASSREDYCYDPTPTECELYMNTDLYLVADFSPIQTYSLNVSVSTNMPGHTGTVTSNPPGIHCSTGSCAADFSPGAKVTLTATPNAGATFEYWSGCDSGSPPGACIVTMDRAHSVQAWFV